MLDELFVFLKRGVKRQEKKRREKRKKKVFLLFAPFAIFNALLGNIIPDYSVY
jgi:hypothetical protein